MTKAETAVLLETLKTLTATVEALRAAVDRLAPPVNSLGGTFTWPPISNQPSPFINPGIGTVQPYVPPGGYTICSSSQADGYVEAQ